jgi:hypothetical protein
MEEKKIQIKTNSCDIGTEEVLISREEKKRKINRKNE